MRYESSQYTAIVQTDLSTAFDTVDSTKLLDKLNYYGIQGNELAILESFMTERQQFVSIDTFKSDIIESPPAQ